MPASVKPIRNFGTKSRLDALRVQLVAGELAVRIGQKIRQRREELGWRQRELADRVVDLLGDAAIDGQRISDYERGVNKPSDRYLNAIAEVLDRDIGWFYESEKTKTPDLFASEVQVDGMAEEFRQYVQDLHAKLDAAQSERERIGALIDKQNENLAKQSLLLSQLRAAVAMLPAVQRAFELLQGEEAEAPPAAQPASEAAALPAAATEDRHQTG